MTDSSARIADELTAPDETTRQRRRRKRHRFNRDAHLLERVRRGALIAFLYLLTIGLTLATWYELLKR